MRSLLKTIIAAVIFLLSLGLANSAVWAHPRVQVTAGEGVSAEMKKEAEIASDDTISFFKARFGVELNHDVKIYLASDKESYKNYLINDLKINPAMAKHLTQFSAGSSYNNVIVEDVSKCHEKSGVISTIAHEMTHQYQRQECSEKFTWLEWFIEGMAEYVASCIVEIEGISKKDQAVNRWLQVLKSAPETPSLSTLHKQDDWYAANGKYAGNLVYWSASYAITYLIKQKGSDSMIDYLRILNTKGNVDVAFRQAFDLDLNDFENRYQIYLANQLASIQ